MQAGFLNFYDGVLGAGDARAALLANNIANADTPGYKAVDIPFGVVVAGRVAADEGAVAQSAPAGPLYRAAVVVGLDGNDVSLDAERVEASQNGEQMAAAATFLHQSTADLITALRPNPGGA